jgi:hypothetical protein
MIDDDAIAAAIRVELNEGLASLGTRRRFDGQLSETAPDRFGATMFELTGRFPGSADTEVSVAVEVDPARVGWRIEAALYEYRDLAPSPELVRDLGSSRVMLVEDAVAAGRRLARAAWAALLLYPGVD